MDSLANVAAHFDQYQGPVDAEDYRMRRTAEEFYQRSWRGSLYYAISFSLVDLIARYDRISVWLLVLPISAFIVLAWLRTRQPPPGPAAGRVDHQRWVWFHWQIILVGLLLWGVIVAAVGWRQAGPDSATMVVTICTVAHATALSHAYGMYPVQARLGLAALIGPGALVFFVPGLHLWPAGVVLSVYSLYLMGTLGQSAKEFNHQIGLEMDLINQRTEIARLSLTDALTALPNRRSYDVVWGQLWHNAVRRGAPLALLILDLDHFKRINDTFGHLAGDACLRHFAGLLVQKWSRKSDYIARIGGEEFVVILPDTPVASAQTEAEALRLTLAAAPCRHEEAEIAMTVSVGVSMVDANVDADPDATFARVDQACYEAKQAGRNCVVAVGPRLLRRSNDRIRSKIAVGSANPIVS